MMNEVMAQLLILKPAALFVICLTFLVFLALFFCVEALKIEGRQNRLGGLFVGLTGRSALMLSCAWIKFIFLFSVLLLAQPAQPVHYITLWGLILLMVLLKPSLSQILTEALGGMLLTAGAAVCATLLDYLRQIRYDGSIRAAYWLLAAFLVLSAGAVLLREIPVISKERDDFDETGEIE